MLKLQDKIDNKQLSIMLNDLDARKHWAKKLLASYKIISDNRDLILNQQNFFGYLQQIFARSLILEIGIIFGKGKDKNEITFKKLIEKCKLSNSEINNFNDRIEKITNSLDENRLFTIRDRSIAHLDQRKNLQSEIEIHILEGSLIEAQNIISELRRKLNMPPILEPLSIIEFEPALIEFLAIIKSLPY